MLAPRSLFPVVLLVMTAFAGCFGSEGDPAEASGPASPTGSGEPTATPLDDPNGTAAPAEAPIAAFTVSAADTNETNLTAGALVLLDASNSTDPAGGNLTFAWDLGDGNTTQGVEANHTFAAAGNYTIVLTVESDATGLTATANVTVEVLAAAPKGRTPVSFTDPSGDGGTNYGDLRVTTMSDDGENLIWKFTLGAVQPGAAEEQVICYSLFVTGAGKTAANRYETYGSGGSFFVYDYTAGADVTGAKAVIAGTGYEVRIPFATVFDAKNIAFPISVRAESRGGECTILGGNSSAIFDVAPNAGTVVYG